MQLFSLALSSSLLLAQGFPPLFNVPPEKIQSVEEVKAALRVYLEPPDFCDTASCRFPLMVETCTLVTKLDARVDGTITGNDSDVGASLDITPADLNLMQLIYGQCQEIEGNGELPFIEGRSIVYQPSCSINNQVRKGLGLKANIC